MAVTQKYILRLKELLGACGGDPSSPAGREICELMHLRVRGMQMALSYQFHDYLMTSALAVFEDPLSSGTPREVVKISTYGAGY